MEDCKSYGEIGDRVRKGDERSLGNEDQAMRALSSWW